MDHPLLLEQHKALRKRVIDFIKDSYTVRRESNIIFVCGGNKVNHMRSKFRAYCEKELTGYDIFLPEFAMKNFFSGDVEDAFDISDFELLIGSLSEAIVIFPEAPGSFAETGYFSAIQELASRSILALNSNFQKYDSFISLGPAKKISQSSKYNSALQINYRKPDFDVIKEKIEKINKVKYKKALKIDEYKRLTNFDLFCLISEIVNILTIATLHDVLFILTAIFKNQYSKLEIKKLLSILVGSKYLKEIGEFGHLCRNPSKPLLLEVRDGRKNENDRIRLTLTALYQSYDEIFTEIVEASYNAD